MTYTEQGPKEQRRTVLTSRAQVYCNSLLEKCTQGQVGYGGHMISAHRNRASPPFSFRSHHYFENIPGQIQAVILPGLIQTGEN